MTEQFASSPERYARLTLCASANTTSVSSEWYNFLLLSNVLQVLQSTIQLQSLDSLGGFSGVLEADSEVRATALCRFGGIDVGWGVADLFVRMFVSETFSLLHGLSRALNIARVKEDRVEIDRTILKMCWV